MIPTIQILMYDYSFEELMSRLNEIKELKIIERRLVRLWPYASRPGGMAPFRSSRNSLDSKSNLLAGYKSWFDDLLSEIASYPDAENNPSPALLVSFDTTPSDWYWEAVRGRCLDDRIKEVTDSIYSCSPTKINGESLALAPQSHGYQKGTIHGS